MTEKIERLPITDDYIFKRVFAYEGNESVLKDLLEAILKKDIKEVQIKNPEIIPYEKGEKRGLLDIKAETDDGTLLDIEMQMENKENTEDTLSINKQLDLLRQQVYILTSMTVENLEDLYQDTEKHAKELGITICLEGDVPENSTYRILLDRAIRECVTNCAKHAHGKRVNVKIEEDWREYLLKLTNDGMVPKKGAREGGGLSALRRALEIEGCRMFTVFEPEFCLLIKMPKTK